MLLITLLLTLSASPERPYLRVVEGKQCQLRAAKAIDAEKARLTSAAIEVYVSYDVALLPAACVPVKPLPAEKKSCDECGCPQRWIYCVKSAAPPAALAKLGYAPVN